MTYLIITRIFYKQHFCKQYQAKIDKKSSKKLSYTLRLNFCYLKIICFLHPRYHPKVIVHILKNVKKTSAPLLKIKMKKRSRRYDINKLRPRHGHKYTKYKLCLSMIMLININPFNSSPHKMIKHTDRIHRLLPTNCLSVFGNCVGLALRGLSNT